MLAVNFSAGLVHAAADEHSTRTDFAIVESVVFNAMVVRGPCKLPAAAAQVAELPALRADAHHTLLQKCISKQMLVAGHAGMYKRLVSGRNLQHTLALVHEVQGALHRRLLSPDNYLFGEVKQDDCLSQGYQQYI